MGNKYFVPDIKLVGFGRLQSYQIVCLKCRKLFFPESSKGIIKELFCSYCEPNKKYIKNRNISDYNFIGNVVGWIVKSDVNFRSRSRYNYQRVYKRDMYICQYCGYSPYYCDEFRPLHIDHILPWSYRGSNNINNLVVACESCNLTASSKWFETFAEKKQYILDNLRSKKIQTYLELKIKFMEKWGN